jgi:hypothetical protein
MVKLLTKEDLVTDFRYGYFRAKKVCSSCFVEKEKFEYHVHRVDRGQTPYRMASACKECVLERQRIRKASKQPPSFIKADKYRFMMYALYGHAGSYSALTKLVGLPFSSCVMALERDVISVKNLNKFRDAYKVLIDGMSDEVVAEAIRRGTDKHLLNMKRRDTRDKSDATQGTRFCVECEQQKFIEEFPRKQLRKTKRVYQSHVCCECTKHKRREREGISHSSRFVRVTPALVEVTQNVLTHYRRKELDERQIWDTLTRGIVSGQRNKVTARCAERILQAERDRLEK